MAIDIGRIAYQAYSDAIQKTSKSVDKDYLYWEDLHKEECDSWRHAAVAVLKYIEESKRQMEENPDLIG
jgi:hypothetical protein